MVDSTNETMTSDPSSSKLFNPGNYSSPLDVRFGLYALLTYKPVCSVSTMPGLFVMRLAHAYEMS